METILILTDCNSWKFRFLVGKNHNENMHIPTFQAIFRYRTGRHGSNNADGWERVTDFAARVVESRTFQ